MVCRRLKHKIVRSDAASLDEVGLALSGTQMGRLQLLFGGILGRGAAADDKVGEMPYAFCVAWCLIWIVERWRLGERAQCQARTST